MIRRRAPALLLAATVGSMLALLGLRVASVGGPLELLFQLLFVISVVGLTVVDLRAAVGVAVVELAVAGASGGWTVFAGGISGRIVLDAVVLGGAVVRLGRLALRRRQLELGRYGPHALLVALLLPGIWIPLGLLNGWSPADAWSDGNAYAFLAFALVPAALAAGGSVAWLRRWLLVACAVTALLTVVLALLAFAGITPAHVLRYVLITVLDMGGQVAQYQAGLRLYLGSGLYLVVGVVLLTWELVERPRRAWPWALLVVFVVALLVSYTRAFWLGAALAAVIVVVVSMPSVRRLAALAGATLLLAVALTGAGWAVGVSLPDYVVRRVMTTFVFVVPDESTVPQSLGRGIGSNATKVHQAQVLLAQAAERPVAGWGFGAIAADYRYGRSYSYELTYLALAYKTGLVGLALFLSFPLRLLYDALRVRLGRLRPPAGLGARDAAVPVALLVSLLAIGATNPYLVASFGLAPIVLCVLWLDPFERLTAGDARPPAGEAAQRRLGAT